MSVNKADAQPFNKEKRLSYGIKGGVSSSTIYMRGADNSDVHCLAGGVGGIYGEYRFTRVFGLSADLLYMGEGFKMDEIEDDDFNLPVYDVRMHNLNVPIMANFHLGKTRRFVLKVGLTPSILLSGKRKMKISGQIYHNDITKNLDRFLVGVSYGASYLFKNGIFLDAGLLMVYRDSDSDKWYSDTYGSTFTFSVGYRFGQK